MRINLRGADIRVAEKRLHVAHVHAVFEQMRGKRMAQGMERRDFCNTRFFQRAFENDLRGAFGEPATPRVAKRFV